MKPETDICLSLSTDFTFGFRYIKLFFFIVCHGGVEGEFLTFANCFHL